MLRFLTILFIFFSLLTFSSFSQPLVGTLTIDNTGAGTYISFTAAINALNSQGVGSGGVTFNVVAGQTFNELPPVITATGTPANPIVFQKNGAGANPKIIPNVPGTITSTTLGVHADGIVIINGGDYITFNGIDLDGNSSYSDATTKYEYGYYTKKASATDACKNVTIRNSTITMYSNTGTMATIGSGIFISNISGTATVVVTSTDGRSENIKLYNNTISGCYNGIQLRGYVHASPYDFYDQNIEVGVDGANSITNYAGGASVGQGIYGIYQNNLKVANNTIVSSATTTTTLYGIFLTTGNNSNVDIYGNTVTVTGGGTTNTVYAINNSMGGTGTNNTVNIYGNTITNCSHPAATSGVLYLCYNNATAFKINIYGNTITNNSVNSGAATSGAMYCLYNSAAVIDSVKIYNNVISNNTKTSTGTFYSLYNSPAATAKSWIYGNTISGSSSAGGTLYGLYNDAGNELHMYQNKVYDLTNTGATGIVYGLGFSSGPLTCNIFNNLIGDLKAPTSSSTSADAIRGISITSTTASSTINLSYNTVYLNASSTGANFYTTGLYHTGSATVTTAVLNAKNNIIVNTSTPSGTGLTIAYRRGLTGFGNYSSESNNNLFYAGAPGAANLIYYFNATENDQLFQDYLARVSPKDNASITENLVPKFLSTTGSSANFLHLNTTIPTQVESGGIPVAGITTDYDGNTRNATTPDIGADEFAGIPADLTGPGILYTDFPNTASTGNRTLTATITDGSGVQVGGANKPRLYYRKSTSPTYVFDNNPTIVGNDYTFTLNTSLIGSLTIGDTVQYYVAAQDSAGNVSTIPVGGSGINPPGTTPPSAPAFYKIVPTLGTATFTVGTGQTYANLTAVANLLLPANSEVTGNPIFELAGTYDGTTETYPIVFGQFNTSNPNNTVTVRPATGVTGIVTSGDPGSNFAFPVINIVGGDHYIFDGRSGGTGTSNEWTIRNNRTAATIGCVIRLADDATNNILRNLNIESQATLTTTGAIFFHTSAGGTTGNSFNSILFNNIRGRTDTPGLSISNGVYSNGTAAALNSDNTVSNNNIYDFTAVGVSLLTTGNGANWTISNNQFYNTTTSTVTQTGISVASATSTNTMITGNFIGGSAPNATGLWVNSGNVLVSGISCANGLATISGNTIGNISGTGVATATRIQGISQTSIVGPFTISNNTIFNLSTTGTSSGVAFGNQTARGIYIGPSGAFSATTVTGNIIDNISVETTTALTVSNVAAGIALYNLQNTVVANNKISNIKNKSTGITPDNYPIACGIFTSFFSNASLVNNMISIGTGENTNTLFSGIVQVGAGGSNVHNYYFNSIYVTGTAGGTISSFGFLRGIYDTASSQYQVSNLKNNLLIMNRTGGGSVNYAVGNKGLLPASGWTSDYNILFNSSVSDIGYWGNAGHNLASWQTTSAGDANSKYKAVNFLNTVTGDLHLTGTSNGDVDLGAVVIAGITTDYDGDIRSSTVPYKGADEAPIPLPVELSSFTSMVTERDIILNWETKSEINSAAFLIERSIKDKNEWMEIGNVKAAVNSLSPVSYTFIDKKLNTGVFNYRLKMTDLDGSFKYSYVIEAEIGMPTVYSLSQNYPNPFNPSTKIDYQLPYDANVTIELFSVTGEKVSTLVNQEQAAGYYTITVSSTSLTQNLASGMYIFRMTAKDQVNRNSFMSIKKMIMLK